MSASKLGLTGNEFSLFCLTSLTQAPRANSVNNWLKQQRFVNSLFCLFVSYPLNVDDGSHMCWAQTESFAGAGYVGGPTMAMIAYKVGVESHLVSMNNMDVRDVD